MGAEGGGIYRGTLRYLHMGQNVIFVNVIDVIVFMCHHSIANSYILYVCMYMYTCAHEVGLRIPVLGVLQ